MWHPPRVVIVDDHPTWRHGFRGVLKMGALAGEIVEACSVAEAMQIVRHDDIVAMDIYLKDGDGITAARDLLKRCPSARVIVVTMSPSRADFDRAVEAGIKGYLVKDAEPEAIIKAFHVVIGGGSFLEPPPAMTGTLPPSAPLPPPFDKLTSRKRTILARVLDNHPSKRIAHDLGISHQYVRNKLSEIYKDLGVKGRGRMAVSKLMREKGIDRLD